MTAGDFGRARRSAVRGAIACVLALLLGATQGVRAEDVSAAEVRLPPYAHRLVGHAFRVGANPRVDAQFRAAYCVSNALVRGASRLQHFAPVQVNDAQVQALAHRILAERMQQPAPVVDAEG